MPAKDVSKFVSNGDKALTRFQTIIDRDTIRGNTPARSGSIAVNASGVNTSTSKDEVFFGKVCVGYMLGLSS